MSTTANHTTTLNQDSTKAEEHQRGFTFGMISLSHQCYTHADTRGSVLEVMDLQRNQGAQIVISAILKYLWFGAGSVPWMGQGKYLLTQLLFLLSGIVIAQQLGAMYELWSALVGTADTQQLGALLEPYSFWMPCLLGVPYTWYVLRVRATTNSYATVKSPKKKREHPGTARGNSSNEVEAGSTATREVGAHAREKPTGSKMTGVLIPSLGDLVSMMTRPHRDTTASTDPWTRQNEQSTVCGNSYLHKFVWSPSLIKLGSSESALGMRG